MRVVVQFGAKKFYSALVRRTHDITPEHITAKLVENVLDDKPIVAESCFLLWEWIATYYHCTLGEVLKAALPSGLKLESEARVSLNDEYSRAMPELLSPKESLLLGIIREKRVISVFELNNTVLKKGTLPVLKELLKKGAIHIAEEIRESYKARHRNHCYPWCGHDIRGEIAADPGFTHKNPKTAGDAPHLPAGK